MTLRTSQHLPQLANFLPMQRTAQPLQHRVLRLMAAMGCLVFAAGTPALGQTAPSTPASQSMPRPAPITPNGTVVEDVIARINDQIITRSDVERAQMQFDQETQGRDLTPDEKAERQHTLLRDLIDQQLLLSKGKEMSINADAQVITQLDEIRKQNHFASMEELEKAASQQGVSFEDFKANIRNNIITQQVVRDQVGRRLQLTHTDAEQYYAAHKADFTQPESVKLNEILISTPSPDGQMPDDATVAAAKAKADDAAAKLKAGTSFEELAKQVSNGPTAAQGGDLGDFKRGALARELEDKTFSLPVGGVTDPIRTRQGYVLLKVTGHTPGGVQPLADVENQVEEAVYMSKMQPALRAYLTQLREDAYIDIKPGFVDAGASPKQTKPVFTAYAPPTVKKKKTAVAKKRFDRHGHIINTEEVAASAAAAATAPAVATAPAASASSAPAVATSTSATRPQTARVIPGKHGKPGKIKREKVRFGQAPRETLPEVAGSQKGTVPTEVGSAKTTTSMVSEALPDQTAAMAENPDPLGPKAGPKVKSRYAARPPEPKKPRVKVKAVPVAPAAPSVEETAAQKTQAAPLGLNGDTSKKKTKVKHKGPKERITSKPAPVAPVAPAPSDTVAPSAIPPPPQPSTATPKP
ncbi:MAG TPA: peptidylprolyl isomerase [Acidobacteriaceae bacterium]